EDEAGQWALEGIEKVEKKWPGIADQLRQRVRELTAKRRDWPTVAALRAEEFFEHPGVGTLHELEKAARKAGCAEAVRAAALHFLETGKRPAASTVEGPALNAVRAGGRSAKATTAAN